MTIVPPGSSTSASRKPVVHEAVAIARRLDADADRRAADGDVLELGRHERQKAVRQAVPHDGLVGGEALDFDRARRRVEREHVVELAERQAPRGGAARLVAEQVRDRRLLEPQRPRAALPIAREPRDLLRS